MDSRQGGEVVVVELVERRQVGGDSAEEVVGIAEQSLSMDRVGNAADGLFEGVDRGAIGEFGQGQPPVLLIQEDCSVEGINGADSSMIVDWSRLLGPPLLPHNLAYLPLLERRRRVQVVGSV